MSILKIARMGHPVLEQVAAPVADPTAPEVARLIADMYETLDDIGGAGLAAPQVHVGLRVVIFEVSAIRTQDESEQEVPRTVLINPEIEPVGGEIAVDWEGCLSVPGLRGAVPRPARIRYSALTPAGERIEREVDGFHARVVQHECDHLDGVLYPMRMADLSTLHFVSEMRNNPRLNRPLAPAAIDDVA
jgi:peptide deformylase